MCPLEDIAIKVESAEGVVVGEAAAARALLHELEAMLRRLLEEGEEGSIDLNGLALTEDDLLLLAEVLGEGEVTADVQAVGLTQVQETGIPGIWWVAHHNENDEVVAEFLEVTFCPEILGAQLEDVKEGIDTLRARLFELNRGV